MKKFVSRSIGFFLSKYIKKIDCSPNNDNKLYLLLQESLFQINNYPLNIQQIEIDSIMLDFIHGNFSIKEISLFNHSNSTNISSHSDKHPKLLKILYSIFSSILFLLFSIFILILFLLFLIFNFFFPRLTQKIINTILKKINFLINSIIIDLEIPENTYDNQNEPINLKILVKSFDLIFSNFDRFEFDLTIDHLQIEIQKQDNTILANLNALNFEIRKEKDEEMINFIFNFKSEIEVTFSLFEIGTILNLFKNVKSLKIENIFSVTKSDVKNETNLKINMNIPSISLNINDSNSTSLLIINAIPTNIQYTSINGVQEMNPSVKFELRNFYHELYNAYNIFNVTFSIKNSNDIQVLELDAEINIFSFDLLRKENNKALIKISMPLLKLKIKEFRIFELNSNEPISFYCSLFDMNTILDIIIELKNIFKNIFLPIFMNNEVNNNVNSDDINELQIKFDIIKIDLFITKSNFPILLLSASPIKLLYPFYNTIQETKIEIKFELKHLRHQIYNIISLFSTIIEISNLNYNIFISSIQTTLTPFLFAEIFSPEINNSSYSEVEHHYENIILKNETGKELLIKSKTNETEHLKLKVNSKNHIKKDDYEQGITILFNNQQYHFLIDNLYSPIFLDKNIIVSLKSSNGTNFIVFSSPYLIQNELSYDIEVIFDSHCPIVIERKSKQFIPCEVNYSLSKSIKVSIFPTFNEFHKLDFKSSKPIKMNKTNNTIDNDHECFINADYFDYYLIYYLTFDSQHSICSIVFKPYITVTNYLPFDLNLSIKDIANLKLKQNESADISFLNKKNKHVRFYFDLDFGEFAQGEKLVHNGEIDSFEEEIDLLQNNEKIGKVIFKCLELKIGNKKAFELSIYSQLILKNESEVPLTFLGSNGVSYNFINKLIFYCSKSLVDNSCFKQLPIFIKKLTKVNSNKFEYLGNFSQVIPLYHINNDNICFLVSLKRKDGKFKNTSVITIQSYFRVINEIDECVIFTATYKNEKEKNIQKYDNFCVKGSTVIMGSIIEGIFDISMEGYQQCINFNFFNLGSSVIRLVNKNDPNLYKIIKLTVKKEENLNCYCCYISYPKYPSYIVIENKLLDKDLYVHQHFQQPVEDFVYHPMVFHPNDKLIFAKEQPFVENELQNPYNINVSFGDDENIKPIKFDDQYRSQKVGNTDYFYNIEINDNDDLLIVFYESHVYRTDSGSNQIVNDENTKITLADIEISYIDNEMHELFLFVLKNVTLNINGKTNFYLEIDGFALNDMYSASLSPVVLHGKEKKIFSLEFSSKNPIQRLKFDKISINFAPIEIFLNFPFVGDLYASIKEIIDCFNQNKTNDNNSSFFMNQFSTNSIFINEFGVDISCVDSSNRKYRFEHPDYFNLLHAKIPFLKEINFTFKKINNFNVQAPLYDFLKSLFDNYKNQLTLTKCDKISTRSVYSKSFDDFLKFRLNKNEQYVDDFTMEYPRRMPRSFCKGKIDNIPSYSRILSSNKYPDVYTNIQYTFQRMEKRKYCDERLYEIFELADKKKLAVFDNYLFITNCSNAKENSMEINYIDINSIEIKAEYLVISSNKERNEFKCKSEQEAISIAKKIDSFKMKISISREAVSFD